MNRLLMHLKGPGKASALPEDLWNGWIKLSAAQGAFYIKSKNKFNLLDENLKEIANLRLENPDMPLVELGKLLKKPVGKSGVNYRLKKIIEIANEL